MAGRSGSKTGGPKVNLTVKTTAKELVSLNLLVSKECDVEWTWDEFFLRSCKIKVNPDKYVVKSGGKEPVLMHQKVRDLIGKFKKIRSSYRVNVIENRKQKAKAPTRPVPCVPVPQAVATTSKTARGIPSSKKGKTGSGSNSRLGIKLEKASARSMSSNASNVTAPIVKGRSPSQPIPDKPNNTRKPGPKRHSKSNIPQENFPRRTRVEPVEDQEVRFPNPSGADQYGGLPTNLNFDEEEDNASQFTTASQESQDDLAQLGITVEDLKPKVIQRMMSNISNVEMLRVRHELKRIMQVGKWNRFSSKSPRTANLLIEIFRITSE